jgi:hypothetical protein
MKNSDNFHIGDIIKKELSRQERSEAWLATKLSFDRSNLHRQLCKEHIAPPLLQKISITLKKDFFACYSKHIRNKIV